MDMKRFFLYAIVIAALALAGCGSDGNPAMTMMPDEPDPDPMPMELDLADLTLGMMLGDAGTLEIEEGGSEESGDVEFSCPAGGGACTVTVTEDEDGAKTATYDGNGGTPTVANTQALIDAENQRLAEEQRLAAEAAAAAAVAATKAAGTKTAAIAAEAEQAENAGLGGSDSDPNDNTVNTTYSLNITNTASGSTVKVEDSALAKDSDPKFMQAMDLGDGLTMHVRTMEADNANNVVEEVVMVKVDSATIEEKQFTELVKLTTNPATEGEEDYRSLAVVTTGTVTTGLSLNDVMGPVASAIAGTEVTQPYGDGSTDAGPVGFAGTYRGASGRYECTTSTCSATTNDKGTVTAMDGTWRFTPDAGATIPVGAGDYTNYGFWLKKTTNGEGAVTYNEVETFAGSSLGASDASDMAVVEGTASYEGGAVGVYVRNVNDEQGEHSATSGHFTADANLMVNFGGDNVAVAKKWTLTGTIDNFALSGDEPNTWSVALEGKTGQHADRSSITAEKFSGTAEGDIVGGSFAGTFFGETPHIGGDSSKGRVSPVAAAGEFNAGFHNGSVAGAFGARKTEE